MRKRIASSILCALMLTAVLVVSIPETGMSQPTTIYVDADEVDPCHNTTYHTVEAGVNAASNGDTVFVCEGYYQETFEIDKKITLEGEDKESTVLALKNATHHILNVTSNYVNITGFTFKYDVSSGHPPQLLKAYQADYLNISGNIFTGNVTDAPTSFIWTYDSDSSLIAENEFHATDVLGPDRYLGVLLRDSSGSVVKTNAFDGTYGSDRTLHIHWSDNITVEGNNFTDKGRSIRFDESRDSLVEGNFCNKSTSGICLLLVDSPYNVVDGNNFSSGASLGTIYLVRANHNDIRNNTVSGAGAKIVLRSSHNNTIENNIMTSTKYRGISVGTTGASHGNEIVNNTVSGSSDSGVYVVSSNSTYMFLNNISDNSGGGVKLVSSYDIVIENCTIERNGAEGVYSSHSTKMMVINSTVLTSTTYDFKSVSSSNGTTLNVTFSTVSVDNTSVLVVKNFLHIKTYDSDQSSPLQNVDILVLDNGDTVYSTSGYGGSNSKTQSDGTVRWIIVTDRWYYHSSTATENITWVEVGAGDKCFYNCPREVDMSTSHWELLYRYIPLWINGTVFNDVDRDGVWDGWNAEPGIPWVTVELHKNIVPPLTVVMWTDYGGNYSFGGCFVEPNVNYTVVEINLPGWRSSTPDSVPVTLPTTNQIVNFGDYSNDSPSAPSYAVSIGIDSTENETVGQNQTLTLHFRIENSGDAPSQARFLRFAAVIEDYSILEFKSPYTGHYDVYSHNNNLLWSGGLSGTLSDEEYAPFDNTGTNTYKMLIWSLYEQIYLDGGGYVLFNFDVYGKSAGDTEVQFFLYSTEDHKSTQGGAYLTSISDKANLFMDNSTGLWYPVHNSYDPWVTAIPPSETAHGHRWDQWSWTPAYTLSSFAKASIQVTVTS